MSYYVRAGIYGWEMQDHPFASDAVDWSVFETEKAARDWIARGGKPDGGGCVTWYVARNHLGQFSRGTSWVKDIADARLYRSVGPAKVAVTKWAKANPGQPVPEVLEWRLDIASAAVLDVSEQTRKRIKRAAASKLDQERQYVLRQLENLKAQEQRIADERTRLEARR